MKVKRCLKKIYGHAYGADHSMSYEKGSVKKHVGSLIKKIMAAGKGCADTKKGCIRKSGSTFYILNNKKGGVWRKGFKSRRAAVNQLSAMHANK